MSRRRDRPLRRRRASSKAARREFLVFVEGLKTEEQYLVHWYRRHRATVIVSIDEFRGGPLQLVQHDVDKKRLDLRVERRGRGRKYDEYWCMFDRDEHPSSGVWRLIASMVER